MTDRSRDESLIERFEDVPRGDRGDFYDLGRVLLYGAHEMVQRSKESGLAFADVPGEDSGGFENERQLPEMLERLYMGVGDANIARERLEELEVGHKEEKRLRE